MKQFRRLLTNIYVYMKTIEIKLFYRGKKNKKVLIILDGLIGDIVLVQDFLKECNSFFKKNNYTVDAFISKSFVRQFYLECCDSYDINVLDICFEKKDAELWDMLHVLKFFKNKEYEYILNPLPKHKGDKLTGCIKSLNKITVRDDLIITGRRFGNYFRKIAYTMTDKVDKKEMEFCRYKRILSLVGDETYSTSLPTLNILSLPKISDEKYCVVAVGASEPGKKLEKDKFVSIVNYIHKKYNKKVVFVGDKGDTENIEYIISHIDNKENALNFAGKTSYKQWVSIINQAELVIGNDSASVHIAAATGCRSICIVGKWQYKRFYPYIVDNDRDYLPIPVFCKQSLPCENCGKVLDLMSNRNCKATIQNCKSYDCISLISVDQVCEKIDFLMLNCISQ